MIFDYERDIKISGSPLWLDAGRRVESCVVTHAHLDHARKHRCILATEATLAFLKKRLGKSRSIVLNYREPYSFDGCTVTLFPAGHILGSAQVLIEKNGLRLLYSGDFNLESSAAAESAEVPESDILIMESTFGRPDYCFPPRAQVEAQLIDFVANTLRSGAVPIVVGYVLGKSQEAMKILGQAGFQLSVHGSIAMLARVYEAHGVPFKNWSKYNKDDLEGKVLIVPRIAVQSRVVKRIENKRIVYLSGWAMNPQLKARMQVDEALPLSDHADFNGLIEYARRTNAKKIYTTHGTRTFAKHLCRLGFDARPLAASRQMSLF